MWDRTEYSSHINFTSYGVKKPEGFKCCTSVLIHNLCTKNNVLEIIF
jgi:hypothetical protein